ncbi:MAG TPA: GGDEF domain-containing protein [Sulfurovum sp.]|nr:GGDEF domain-containing protein [Sulfurovum sp.]
MKHIQNILNSILSKDIFEYILVDKTFKIVATSSGLDKYLEAVPKRGDDVLKYCPELFGSEKEIQKIFSNQSMAYVLESVHKKEYYVNLSVEYYDKDAVLVLLHNITDTTLTQQKLLQYSNESILLNNTLQKILDSQNAILFVTHNNEISYTNDQFMKYFDMKRVIDMRRKNLKIYEYLDETLESYDDLFERVKNKEEYVTINHDTFILKATWIESTHKLFTLTKVTKLTHNMQMDTLTGVYKKSYFNTRIEKIIRDKEEAAVVVIDIDDFKSVNDTFGHQAGDDVLKEFATLIQKNIRGDDVFSRWGGEEFLLLLQHANMENALKKVEQLRTLVEKNKFQHIGHMTASFGLTIKEEGDDMHTILQRADKALYEAKKSGKNCVKFKIL